MYPLRIWPKRMSTKLWRKCRFIWSYHCVIRLTNHIGIFCWLLRSEYGYLLPQPSWRSVTVFPWLDCIHGPHNGYVHSFVVLYIPCSSLPYIRRYCLCVVVIEKKAFCQVSKEVWPHVQNSTGDSGMCLLNGEYSSASVCPLCTYLNVCSIEAYEPRGRIISFQ